MRFNMAWADSIQIPLCLLQRLSTLGRGIRASVFRATLAAWHCVVEIRCLYTLDADLYAVDVSDRAAAIVDAGDEAGEDGGWWYNIGEDPARLLRELSSVITQRRPSR